MSGFQIVAKNHGNMQTKNSMCWCIDVSGDELHEKYFCAVWRSTSLPKHQCTEAEEFLSTVTGCDGIKIAGCVETLPDDYGPGGREDVILLIPMEHMNKFAIKRFQLGDDRPIWPEDLREYYAPEVERFVKFYRN